MRLRYTPRATRELNAILDFLEQRSPLGARRVKARLRALAAFVQERPFGGQKTSEDGLRRVVATPYPYILYYEVFGDEVVIVGVRHAARDRRGEGDETDA